MQKHDLGGWWLEAGVSSPCGIPGPDSAAAGAPRPAGAHTATQICRAGAAVTACSCRVCVVTAVTSLTPLMLVFCSAGFTILQRCSRRLGGGVWSACSS